MAVGRKTNCIVLVYKYILVNTPFTWYVCL